MADLYESPRLAWSTSEPQDMQDHTVKPILRKQQRTRRKRSRKRRRKRKTDRKTKKKSLKQFVHFILHIFYNNKRAQHHSPVFCTSVECFIP